MRLAGVEAIVTEGFERIHRTNLVGMGVLPLLKYIRGCVLSEQEYVDKYKKAYPNLKFISNSNSQGLFGKREWTTIGY